MKDNSTENRLCSVLQHHDLKLSDRPPVTKLPINEIEGFHFLRSVFSILIVAIKTNLMLIAEILVSSSFALILTANVAYLAVPVFFQISLFLFYLKSESKGLLYFVQKRLPKLTLLYLFWVGLKVLFDILIKGEFETLREAALSARTLIEFIVSGGQSIFFFLFSLLILNLMAAFLMTYFKKVKQPQGKTLIAYGFLFASCSFVFLCKIAETIAIHFTDDPTKIPTTLANIAFWDFNPLNFLPYLFTALITFQELKQGTMRVWSTRLKLKSCILFTLFLGFTLIEWQLFDEQLHYARLSLIFGSWLLLDLAIMSRLKVPTIIKSFSAFSLGIYGYHIFVEESLSLSSSNIWEGGLTTHPGLEALFVFLTSLLGAIALTIVSKRVKYLKNFV